MKKTLIAFALMATSGVLFAQPGQIVITGATGPGGTVAAGSSAMGAASGMPVRPGSVITAAQGGTITVRFPSGCTATVVAGTPFTASEANCQQLAANNSQRLTQQANTGPTFGPQTAPIFTNPFVYVPAGLGTAWGIDRLVNEESPRLRASPT